MQDLMDDTYDITEIMSRNYSMPDGIDDDELLAELDDLEVDMLQDSSYLDDVSVPTTAPSRQEKVQNEEPAMGLYQWFLLFSVERNKPSMDENQNQYKLLIAHF